MCWLSWKIHFNLLFFGAVSQTNLKLEVSFYSEGIMINRMREKPKNAPVIHSVYSFCTVAATCFGITLPSSGSVPSAF
jgi:hypothetical protein